MSSEHRSQGNRAGFMLAEAFVALVVATMLVMVLTRLMANTRSNAAEVRAQLEMSTLGRTLLASLGASQALKAGKTRGRAGRLAWQIDITPFTAAPEFSLRSAGRPAGVIAATETGNSADLERSSQSARIATAASAQWMLYLVKVKVEGPSGRQYAIDAIRIGPKEADER